MPQGYSTDHSARMQLMMMMMSGLAERVINNPQDTLHAQSKIQACVLYIYCEIVHELCSKL